jgi:DNA polymerase I-like protein with 3'-5' exonuclease and polymerase domains
MDMDLCLIKTLKYHQHGTEVGYALVVEGLGKYMSDLRKCFKSRFQPDGVLLELDYSQLEIIVLAHLSKDEQLIKDLIAGTDLHSISATNLFGRVFTKEERTLAKQLSFQLQYGAGYKSMAESNNISEEVAKKFIKQYYDRYPGVRDWQVKTQVNINLARKISPYRTKKGMPAGKAILISETGRQYTFIEKDSPEWYLVHRPATSFQPTEIKNYPVQGLATGDIVPMMVGKLYRKLCQWETWRVEFFMVSTTHDSVLFDCSHVDVAQGLSLGAKEIMEQAPLYLKSIFNIDFELPLKVEASIGKNWKDMVKIDLV